MAIYKEKEDKWTKDGRKYYYKCYYIDMYGNNKRKRSKLYLSQKEAKEAEREFLTNIKNNDEHDYNVSFEKVYNEWLNLKKDKIKVTSYYRLKCNLNKNILKYFKNFKLSSIKYNIIDNWKKELINMAMSVKYKNSIIKYLKEILTYAKINYEFDEKIIDRICTIRDDTPKDKKSDSELNFWTYDEFKKFISVVDDNLYYLIFTFLYFTGLRFGEFAALTWKDIDLKNKTVTINKSLTNKVEGQKYIITSPKTNNSIRTVDLDDNLVKLLNTHKSKEKSIYGFNDNMFVFGNVKYIAQTTFVNHLKYYCNISKVKYISPHGFRHSHISLLIDLGCDARDVANRVGDTVQMIEKTYIHMFPSKKKKTVNLLNDLKK